jgi:hypothetical protein
MGVLGESTFAGRAASTTAPCLSLGRSGRASTDVSVLRLGATEKPRAGVMQSFMYVDVAERSCAAIESDLESTFFAFPGFLERP